MSINFNRNRVQTEYENFLGITSLDDLKSKKEKFKSHILSEAEVEKLQEAVKLDALDFFNNAVISFSEGIDSIYLNRLSWATVKLYYSVYYLLRTSMATKKFALLRNQSMYRLKIKQGEHPFNTGNKKYNSTHSGTISHYRDVCNGIDVLLTNTIEGLDAYEWMEQARDIVNYVDASFRDPESLNIWDKYRESLSNGNLSSLLNAIQNDTEYMYCFQEDYAVVAIPIKRMQLTIEDMCTCGYLKDIIKSRNIYYNNILKEDKRGLELLSKLHD